MWSREYLSIVVNHLLRGEDMVATMEHLKAVYHRVPRRIQVDNGSEFIAKVLDRGITKWCWTSRAPGNPRTTR